MIFPALIQLLLFRWCLSRHWKCWPGDQGILFQWRFPGKNLWTWSAYGKFRCSFLMPSDFQLALELKIKKKICVKFVMNYLLSLQDQVDSIKYANNCDKFVSGSKDGAARLWRYERQSWKAILLNMGQQLSRYVCLLCIMHVSEFADLVKWTSEYSFVEVSSVQLGISKFSSEARESVDEKKKYSVTMIEWTNDDTYIITAVNDNSLKVWDSNGQLVNILKGHQDEVYVLENNPVDPRIMLSAGHDGNIILWDLTRGVQVTKNFNTVHTSLCSFASKAVFVKSICNCLSLLFCPVLCFVLSTVLWTRGSIPFAFQSVDIWSGTWRCLWLQMGSWRAEFCHNRFTRLRQALWLGFQWKVQNSKWQIDLVLLLPAFCSCFEPMAERLQQLIIQAMFWWVLPLHFLSCQRSTSSTRTTDR